MPSTPSSIPVSSLASWSDGRYMLRSAGRREGVHFDSHRDDYYLFGVMLSGVHTLMVDFQEITLAARQAVIISPGQVHRSESNVTEGGFGIAFSPESMKESEISLIDEYSLRPHPITLGDADFRDIRAIYEILLHRADCHDDTGFCLASSIKSIILHQLPQEVGTAPNRYIRLVKELRRLLKDNVAKEKSPSAYAAMMNVSGVYLNEAVKAVTGMSAGAFIISFAMLAAKRRMVYTGLSAQEIAFQLGYEDYSYFSRLFRRYVGQSPREFRGKYLK